MGDTAWRRRGRVWENNPSYSQAGGILRTYFGQEWVIPLKSFLGDALDEVRRGEYRRIAAKECAFIKGQRYRYTLLSHRENLSLAGPRSLDKLPKANKRLNTAYLLKVSFIQLWSYQTEGWARAVFERWRESLKWQRLKPYEKFAAMIDCYLENKVTLVLVEGLNNKIRVLQLP